MLRRSAGICGLQVGHQARGDHRFGHSGDREVANHHGRYSDCQRIGRIERNAAGVVKENRLNAELDGSDESRSIGGEITCDGRCNHPSARSESCTCGDRAVRRIGHKRAHDRHVEAIRTEGGDAAVAEKQGLNGERDRDSDRMDPAGPSTMVAMVTPSACPVVPPGSGRLNIITTKENAAKTEISGIMRAFSVRLMRTQGSLPARSPRPP